MPVSWVNFYIRWIIISTYYLTGSLLVASNSTDQSAVTLNSEVPLEFPEFSQNFTFVDNSSIRENLANHSENDREVEDLLKERSPATARLAINVNPMEEIDDVSKIGDSVEMIDDEASESTLTQMGSTTMGPVLVVSKVVENAPPYLLRGQVAAILAGTFLLISIVGYVALLSWRRYLEHRYGSREILVDEDDFIDPEDMKHFSI